MDKTCLKGKLRPVSGENLALCKPYCSMCLSDQEELTSIGKSSGYHRTCGESGSKQSVSN